jgi:hypothetical protein
MDYQEYGKSNSMRGDVLLLFRGGITWIDVLTFGEEDGRPVRAAGGRQIIPEVLNP